MESGPYCRHACYYAPIYRPLFRKQIGSGGVEYGDKELIPGLWYYDDGYVHNSRWDEWVEAMLRKRKNRK
jgi:hypothetical protein